MAWKNWGWQKEFGYSERDAAEIYGNYKKLFGEIIPDILAQCEDTHPYIPSSPISNWGNHENFNSGNMHYWGVWHGEEAIDSFRVNVPRFMTEYGMQSFLSFTSLKSDASSDLINMNSDFINNRQRSYKGNGLLLKYVEAQFGPAKDVESLCYLSQLNQAEAMRIAIESHRKQARFCMGSLYWQLNDVWNGASWSTIEHNGTWKAAHYNLQRLYATNILIAETIHDTTFVHLQSDSPEGINGKLHVEVFDFKGRSLGSFWSEAKTGYLVATPVFEMPVRKILNKNDRNSFFLKIELLKGDSVICQALHYLVPPKALKLTAPVIQSGVSGTPGEVVIKLKSNVLAKNVMLEFEKATGSFTDNYFDLLPNEEKIITFKSDMPEHGKLKIRSYLP